MNAAATTRLSSLSLAAALGSLMRRGRGPVPKVVLREQNPSAATFASDIVTVRLGSTHVRLLCKQGVEPRDDPTGRRGLAYEAIVYQQVLAPLAVDAPHLYGFCTDPATGINLLVLEFMEGLVQADRADSRETSLRLASHWLGTFHAQAERLIERLPPIGVQHYDRDYYVRWARRTARLAGELHDRYPWLADVCMRYEGLVDHLLSAAPTVVHGDYYLTNILVGGGRVVPVDWEWAAVGAGEVDLAALTFRWPPDVAALCEANYKAARWPAGPPRDFDLALSVARLFLCLRYMGNGRDWLLDERRSWRFEAVRTLSEQLGLIEPRVATGGDR